MTVDELKLALRGDFLKKFEALTEEQQIYASEGSCLAEARVRISVCAFGMDADSEGDEIEH